MTRPRPSYTSPPRIWDQTQINDRLGKGGNWHHNHRAELEALDFPAYDDLLGGWDANAIEAWLDKRAGLSNSCDPVDADKEIERWEASQCGTS